jgi:hypothetical protein
MMDQQQAGMITIVSLPNAFRAYRIDKDAPQPGQAKWPEYINSCSGIRGFISTRAISTSLFLLIF